MCSLHSIPRLIAVEWYIWIESSRWENCYYFFCRKVSFLYWIILYIHKVRQLVYYSHHFESFTVATMTWLTVMEYPCLKWPRICSTCRKDVPVLSSCMAYHRDYTKGVIRIRILKNRTQWPKGKVQKDKQWSTKHTYKTKDRVTRTPLKTVVGFLLAKLNSSFRKFYGRHHDLVDSYAIFVLQMTTDMFHLSQTLPGLFRICDLSPG
jgi:hypothetical protein